MKSTKPLVHSAWLSMTLLGPALAWAQAGQGSIVGWGDNWSGQSNVPTPNRGFIAIAEGWSHSLGLTMYGSILAWGSNGEGQTNVPAPNTGFITVAAGVEHSLGLKGDGSIVAWGDNYSGQTDVPAPNTGFVALAAGEWHSLGLKADGSIVVWGHNWYGVTDVPVPNTGFIAVAGGSYYNLGLKGVGSIVAWGNNEYGQTDVPEPNTGFIAIAAGRYQSVGLKGDGSIVAWGCGDPSYNFGQCTVPAPNGGFIAVAGGAFHSLALKGDGAIVAWGAGGPGQSGWPNSGQSTVPEPNSGFAAIAAGGFHSLGMKGPVWDVTADFSIEDGNPNRDWTYGWMDTGFATFTPYVNSAQDSNGLHWYGWGADYTPGVWKNTSTGSVDGVAPGQLALHPGDGEQPSVVRWTAPAGVSAASIAGRFYPGDIGTMSAAVRLNNASIWNGVDSGTFHLNVNIRPGDRIDFAIYGDYYNGNTPLQARISVSACGNNIVEPDQGEECDGAATDGLCRPFQCRPPGDSLGGCTCACPPSGCCCDGDMAPPFFGGPSHQPDLIDFFYIFECWYGSRSGPECDVNCDGVVTYRDVGDGICLLMGLSECCSRPHGVCCVTSYPQCREQPNIISCGGTYLGDGTTCDVGPCDCNNNGILDRCDVDCGPPGSVCNVPGCGQRPDCNRNQYPDECENPAPTTLAARGETQFRACSPLSSGEANQGI